MDYPNLAVKAIFLVMPMRRLRHILTVAIGIVLLPVAMMSQTAPLPECATTSAEIVASFVAGEIVVDAEHPAPEWRSAKPVAFCSDWQGNNPDQQGNRSLPRN